MCFVAHMNSDVLEAFQINKDLATGSNYEVTRLVDAVTYGMPV